MDVAKALIATSPLTTIVGETSIGALLLAPSSYPRLHRAGLALALLLHAGIALTPPPNNIAEYGIMSAARLSWLLAGTVGVALVEVVSRPSAACACLCC